MALPPYSYETVYMFLKLRDSNKQPKQTGKKEEGNI
jgi:hypothetical protein